MYNDYNDENNKYDIGYKKPPVKNQFQKGKSGNPNGRPVGSQNKKIDYVDFKDIFLKEGSTLVKVETEEGCEYLTKLQLSIRQLANNAAKGDLKASRYLLETTAKITEKDSIINADFDLLYQELKDNVIAEKKCSGSYKHIKALYNCYKFKKTIRAAEGQYMWPFEDDEPRTEEDWILLERIYYNISKNPSNTVQWPPEYPSEVEAEKEDTK